ncbi:MAG: hypothetical protein WCN98_03840 [Verrucomicrobiaceae bacterium]
MADQVKVTSIDALESFRASMILFQAKARRSLDMVGDEVRRTRQWLENNQRVHWEGEVRKWRKNYDRAQQELLSARLSEFIDSPSAQQSALRKAKHALDEAEDKLRRVKAWNRDFDGATEPLTRSLEGLRHFLEGEIPHGIAYLSQAQKTLESYAETFSPGTTATPPAEPETSA